MDFDVIELVLKSPWAFISIGASIFLALVFCSIQLLRFGPAIRQLNKIEVLSQLYYLAEQQKGMTREFGAALASSNATRLTTEQLRVDLEGLRDFIIEVQEKLSEYNADNITRSRLELDAEPLPTGTFYRGPIPDPLRTPDQLFQSMRGEWKKFGDAFKQRLEDANISPQLNRMGKMTYMLTDKRRRNPLPLETADLITALHSQYRRYLALRAINTLEHDNFVQLVQTAIKELQAPAKQGELGLTQSTNGALDAERPPRLM